MNRYSRLSILAIAIATLSSFAYSSEHGVENDAMVINQAKIPLTQAVTLAEQHTHGKATRAEYENSKHGWVYDVEVVSGTRVFDVKVDANLGTILSSVEDKKD
ncbi:Peptidase propeptide and YPEB domain [Serratia fonticola]|uniref:PepSY domain-containing protein n=1 Tax=Serratia fonticola TaxID=47917 RepID=UPI0004055EEE|nr:PepSY domain-containing protein [Serratia fonticola]CAI2029359.1 Peptidase propeptide and YPEB domain [Serratia fonticola]